jgi:pSer/pThr/pTyr-binding forkhead associated (FHA) protein
MARLILSLDSQVLAEYNMSKERYTIGRLPDNDVRIEDLNSTNGTYVNGKLIKKHALQHGDVITVGHHQLRFSDQQANQTEQDEFEKTMVIPAGEQDAEQLARAEQAAAAAAAAEAPAAADPAAAAAARVDVSVDMPTPKPEPKPEPAPAPVAETVAESPAVAASAPEPPSHAATAAGIDPSNAPNALPLAKLQVLSGAFAGRELDLTKALTTLGRPGVQVAAITRRAEGYFIVHVESGEEGDYPLVNGQPIGAQARKLTDNDVVQLAGVKMGFFAS